jgi:Sortase domain
VLVGAVTLPGLGARASPAATELVPPGASMFLAVEPSRLADTRLTEGAYGFERVSADTIRVRVAGRSGVPPDATAVVINIVAVDAKGAGVVTAFPAGTDMPTASALNVSEGHTIANLATVRLGVDGAIDIAASVAVELVIDVDGAYVPRTAPTSSGRLQMLAAGAARVLDTRLDGSRLDAGAERTISLAAWGAPADAIAAVVNLVAIDAAPGFWTLYPRAGDRPATSSLNVDAIGQTRSAQAIVRLDGRRPEFSIFSQTGGDLVVDLAGWFTGASAAATTDGLFVPTPPMRMLDTRYSSSITPWGGTTVEFDSGSPFPTSAAAVAMNITTTDPLLPGFITAYPAGEDRPGSSNLNVTGLDQVTANHAIVRIGSRGVALYTQAGAQMVVDVSGWYLGHPAAGTKPSPPNPSASATSAAAIFGPGVSVDVGYGPDLDAVIDVGRAGLWDGVGLLGVRRNNVFFAHRTTHGAPFRNLDRLVPGTVFVIEGADGRGYRYLVTRQDVIVPRSTVLQTILDRSGPITATLVACHPPGSIRYRIVVTGRLIGLAP